MKQSPFPKLYTGNNQDSSDIKPIEVIQVTRGRKLNNTRKYSQQDKDEISGGALFDEEKDNIPTKAEEDIPDKESEESGEESGEESEDIPVVTCKHIFLSGNRLGDSCNRVPMQGEYCHQHKNRKISQPKVGLKKNTCIHIMASGIRQGNACGGTCLDKYCHKHKSDLIPKPPKPIKVPKVPKSKQVKPTKVQEEYMPSSTTGILKSSLLSIRGYEVNNPQQEVNIPVKPVQQIVQSVQPVQPQIYNDYPMMSEEFLRYFR